MEQIVRAIDVGYGNCKYVSRVQNGRFVCHSFPAIAPLASDHGLDLDPKNKRKTITVPAGSLEYEVGPDVMLAQGVFEIRNLDDDYVLSDDYLALVRGALRYMRLDHIDLLMVGLPVNLLKRRKADLEKRLQGIHELGDGKRINVKRVRAMAQPMGSFLAYAVPHKQQESLLLKRNVIIDPGWRTYDWVVTQDMKVWDKRSDAVNKGMYDVIDEIAKAIGKERQTAVGLVNYERIDTALRQKTALSLAGKVIDLSHYIDAGKRVAQQGVMAMRKLVSDGDDIDNFIISGGGSFFYKPLIQLAYPSHPIIELDDPMFANVRGFQIAGVEMMDAFAFKQPARKEHTADEAHVE